MGFHRLPACQIWLPEFVNKVLLAPQPHPPNSCGLCCFDASGQAAQLWPRPHGSPSLHICRVSMVRGQTPSFRPHLLGQQLGSRKPWLCRKLWTWCPWDIFEGDGQGKVVGVGAALPLQGMKISKQRGTARHSQDLLLTYLGLAELPLIPAGSALGPLFTTGEAWVGLHRPLSSSLAPCTQAHWHGGPSHQEAPVLPWSPLHCGSP